MVTGFFMAFSVAPERQPVYGHELLGLLAELGGSSSIEKLGEAAAAKFGSDAVYANCGGNLFTFHQVLGFLESVGKLSRQESDVSLGHVPGCSHH